ncbi:MAG: helix-turn-helix transcriptional regulator [Oscillospiraceae bacterium]|nr:helix-turn-helix transcriptional regulator [Oscillospiraceae bacterium]MBR6595191.1 helix-turn-helix transcriptional regulator [Oscillospiraceae bacterium]
MGSMFFERYSALCKEHDETPNSVAKKIGASSGSVTAWKKGTDPRNATLAKIADFFGVTTDYLLGKENEKAPAESGKRSVSDDEIKFALFGGDGEITDAMFEEVKNFAAFVKAREEAKKKE